MDETLILATPEEIQLRILVTLHGQYMNDYRVPVVFMQKALITCDPAWQDITRELIQLEYREWISFSSDLMPDTVMCKLTPKGREVFEELVTSTSRRVRIRIGFEADKEEGRC